MIKKNTLINIPTAIAPTENNDGFSLISAAEFSSESAEFLKKYYKGCFTVALSKSVNKIIRISVDGFAEVLKELVKSVFGKQAIYISFKSFSNKIDFEMKFDTSAINDDKQSELIKLAEKSGFKLLFSSEKAVAEFEFAATPISVISSISTRIVYNALSSVFNLS